MEYKWNNPPIAKTSFEIYKCLAKERHFSRETMKNFINNNIEYHDASLFKSSKAICDKINKAIKDNKKIVISQPKMNKRKISVKNTSRYYRSTPISIGVLFI